MMKGMSLKSSRLSAAVRQNHLPWNEGNRSGACPSQDPSHNTPTPHCGQLSLIESVNQALGKTPATIRLDHLTPLLEVIARKGDFVPAVDLHGGGAAQKWECKSLSVDQSMVHVSGKRRVDDIFKKGGC
jgi:hypothetical protein